MLGQRRRRWYNSKSALGQCIVFSWLPFALTDSLTTTGVIYNFKYILSPNYTPCKDFSCNRSHSTPECDEAFSTYLSTPLHATPNCRPAPKFQTLPKIMKVLHVEQIKLLLQEICYPYISNSSMS